MDNKFEDEANQTLAKDKYGRPIKVPAKARRKRTWEEMQTSKNDSTSTYAFDSRGFNDEEMKDLFGKTTLVSDRSRVYKGGSWNDRAYWLNPGTRRFMQQDESDAMTGFRCAMTMVGTSFGPFATSGSSKKASKSGGGRKSSGSSRSAP